MQSHLPRLFVSPETLASIRKTVEQTPEGIETGVTLFGARGDSGFMVLAAVGPGPNAIHTPSFHQPDANQRLSHFVDNRACGIGSSRNRRIPGA